MNNTIYGATTVTPVPIGGGTADLTALAIQNKVSGKSITLTDVSPLPHKCSCKLTSDTYEETTGSSKNVYDFTNGNVYVASGDGSSLENVTVIYNRDGSFTLNGEIQAFTPVRMSYRFSNLIAGQQYTVSLRNSENKTLSFQFLEFSPEGIPESGFGVEHNTKYTFTASAEVSQYAIDCVIMSSATPISFNITYYMQLELGGTMTKWQPAGGEIVEKDYIEDFSAVKLIVSNGKSSVEYTPNADGTVTGIESVSPTMEITTDNEHVNIVDFTYCVDTKSYVDGKEVNLDEYMKEPTNVVTVDRVLARRTGTDENIWMKVDASNGLSLLANGNMIVSGATKIYIDEKKSSSKPIGPNMLDYAVKVGLTTNKETLTEEEKTAALNWLGGMLKPKNPTRNSVVTMNGSGGVNTSQLVHESVTSWTVPMRDDNGCIKTATPIANLDAATKKYVDDAIAALKAELQR